MTRPQPPGLWQPSFMLLWQGQLVSALGDAVYRVALGFWVLDATGSTALMGALLAAPLVVRMLLSPWAGALADRADRRWLLVASDLASGLVVSAVGLAALGGALRIWMVLAASLVVGAALSVLQPTIESALPDLVDAPDLGRANAAMAASASGAAIVGNGVGGILFTLVGAPTLFLANGLSFLMSAASELFIRLPRARGSVAPEPRAHDDAGTAPARRPGDGWADVARQLWSTRGVRDLLLLTGATHLGSTAVLVLLVPHFHGRAGLGPRVYGFAMAALGAGAFVGYGLGAAKRIANELRARMFISLGLLEAGSLALLPWLESPAAIVTSMAGVGLAMAVGSTIVTTGLQLAVPSAKRGRLFGLRASWMLALTSLATLVAGAAAEWMATGVLVTAAATAMSLAYGATYLLPAARQVLAARTS